jgi:hypothetical protein
VLAVATFLLIAVAAVLALTPVVDRHRRAVLRRCLRDVAEVLNANGVDYWCDYGTLLGQHREGDLILGDKDVDLCTLVEEQPKVLALAAELNRRGYQVTDRGGESRRILRVSDRLTSYHVDIYTFARDGEMLRSVLRDPGEDVPERLVASRVPVAFLGTTVLVPRDTPALLLYRYGPGYTRPLRNDKGRARPHSRVHSLYEDLYYDCVGLWALAATAASRAFRRRPAVSPRKAACRD